MTVEDGLNIDKLAGQLGGVARQAGKARSLIEEHMAEHPHGYVAWSGGKDSTAVVDLVRRIVPDMPVCWFHSGLEYPETEQFIYRVADDWSLNLHVVFASPDALTLLAATGDWEHGVPDGPTGGFHDTLIGEPSRRAHQVHGPGELVGLRAEESVARRRTLAGTGGRYVRADGTAVCAPVWGWGIRDVYGYSAVNRVPVNPVYGKLARLGAPEQFRRVGLMVDGNSLPFGAVTWLRLGWPEVWGRLVDVLPRLNEWR